MPSPRLIYGFLLLPRGREIRCGVYHLRRLGFKKTVCFKTHLYKRRRKHNRAVVAVVVAVAVAVAVAARAGGGSGGGRGGGDGGARSPIPKAIAKQAIPIRWFGCDHMRFASIWQFPGFHGCHGRMPHL